MSNLNKILDTYQTYQKTNPQPETWVLGTTIHTEGATYTKPGARMLISPQGEFHGLLSGGCLENDLYQHAKEVLRLNRAQVVEYDSRFEEDLLWGTGSGCQGLLRVLLQPFTAPLMPFHEATTCIVALQDIDGICTLGETHWLESGHYGKFSPLDSAPNKSATIQVLEVQGQQCECFVEHMEPSHHLLILGAGPDVQPVVHLAKTLSWQVSVLDHRSGFAKDSLFPEADHVFHAPDKVLENHVELSKVQAVVLMSHHFESDVQYLKQLHPSSIPYIGILGPRHRSERLLKSIEQSRASFGERLRIPVGLPIGGRTPEVIALSIVGEIQSLLQPS